MNAITSILLGVVVGVALTLLSVGLGSWLAHRARNNLSPLPPLGSWAGKAIGVLKKKKRPMSVPKHPTMPRMRS